MLGPVVRQVIFSVGCRPQYQEKRGSLPTFGSSSMLGVLTVDPRLQSYLSLGTTITASILE